MKQLHEITLRDVILLDATKRTDTLKSYRFEWLRRSKMEKLAKQIFTLIGGETISEIEDEFEKLNAYRKLQMYDALLKAVNIEFNLKGKISAWKIILNRDFKESAQLGKVISEVKRLTGIEISKPEDLKMLSDYVQHKVDKYNEMFPEKQEEDEENHVNLSKIIYSIFNYLGEPYNENMRLITFIEMKAEAEDRIKRSNTQENGEY